MLALTSLLIRQPDRAVALHTLCLLLHKEVIDDARIFKRLRGRLRVAQLHYAKHATGVVDSVRVRDLWRSVRGRLQ